MSKSVIVNGEFQQIISALERRGAAIAAIKPNPHLPKPTAAHADMNYFVLEDEIFVVGGAETKFLESKGYKITNLDKSGNKYPYDVICNAKLIGEHLFCNVRTIDRRIIDSAKQKNYNIIDVRQGYTGCSICKVNDNAIITSDKGIAKAASENKLDVLLIDNSDIVLPGYDVGFIGGCTGLISNNELLFTGNLDKCSFGTAMREFCNHYGVSVIELTNDRPIDVGGFLVL